MKSKTERSLTAEEISKELTKGHVMEILIDDLVGKVVDVTSTAKTDYYNVTLRRGRLNIYVDVHKDERFSILEDEMVLAKLYDAQYISRFDNTIYAEGLVDEIGPCYVKGSLDNFAGWTPLTGEEEELLKQLLSGFLNRVSKI